MQDKNTAVAYQWLGRIAYADAWQLQRNLVAQAVALKLANREHESENPDPTAPQPPVTPQPIPNHLLFCEHPHVYTLGKSGKITNLLVNEDELRALGVEFYHIERGGDITYHGPGQLVGYPIFDLENFFTDLHRYLRTLEEAVIRTCAHWGVAAGVYPGLTGVWIEPQTPQARKICAMGIKCSRWITMHGFAFNLNTDLRYFDYIIPCGINDKAVTSLAREVGAPIDEAAVRQVLLDELATGFGFVTQVTNAV